MSYDCSRRFLLAVAHSALVLFWLGMEQTGLSAGAVQVIQEAVFSGSETLEAKLDPRFSQQQVSAGFGLFGELDFSGTRLRSLRQSYGLMTESTELRFPNEVQAAPACGPSRRLNEMVCLSQKTGELIARVPIPGTVTAAPLFHKGSWLVATSKGFVFRTTGLSVEGAPVLGMENMAFWGSGSSERMSYLRRFFRQGSQQAEVSEEVSEGRAAAVETQRNALEFVQVGWGWYLWSSSEFVSHFVVQGSRVVAMTANQFVYAIDFETGQTVWAQRIGAEDDLRLQSAALSVTARHVVVGAASGEVILLNPNTGAIEWKMALRAGPGERFPGVVAPPLVIGQSVVASSSSGETVLINERTKQVEWTVPHGSTASARRIGESILLGTSDGKVLKIDVSTGQVQRRLDLGRQSPVASLAVLSKERLVLIGLVDGSIQVRSTVDFSLSQTFASMGPFEGEFTGTLGAESTCITLKDGVLRCFKSF